MVNDQTPPLSSRERRNSLAAAVVVTLLLLIGFWPGFERTGLPMDEGMLLVYPELVAHGQLPYRDFETFYGPANPYVLAGAYSIFGTNIFTERAVGLFYRVAFVMAVFGIARRWGTLLATGCMFVSGALLICTTPLASGWIAAAACALISVCILSSGAGLWNYFFGGLMAGFALLYRPDIVPAILLSSLPFLWRISWRISARYAVGIGIGLLPLAVVTVFAGATNVWNNLFFYPVLASNPGRRLPLFSAHPYVLNLLCLHLLGSFAMLAAAVMELRRERGSRAGRVLLSLAILALMLTPQATQRLDIAHFLFAGVISPSFLALPIAILAQRSATTAKSMAVIGLLGAIVLIETVAPELTATVRSAFGKALSTKDGGAFFVEHRGRSFPFDTEAAAGDAKRLFDKLETVSKPGDRLFVGPGDLRRTNYCDTFIYHLFPKLHPATYFLEMNPLSANRPGSRLANDLASADWVVLNRALDDWKEQNRSAEYGEDRANRVVLSEFELIGEYGSYGLFHRKAASERMP